MMNANFKKVIKTAAINHVNDFKGFKANKIEVIANSVDYPNSITLTMDILCSPYDGYIFVNVADKTYYALTAEQVTAVFTTMYNNKRTIQPKDKRDLGLLRLEFSYINEYRFEL